MKENFTIYGIFRDSECLYVGRTLNPERRKKYHKTRFPGSDFRVLANAETLNQASRLESKFIREYKEKGQATANGNLFPESKSTTVDMELHRRLKVFAAKNGLKLGNLLDEAVRQFLKKGVVK